MNEEFKHKIGQKYIAEYQGLYSMSLDRDGTLYTVNQNKAQYHYIWTTGSLGVGYYLQENEEY